MAGNPGAGHIGKGAKRLWRDYRGPVLFVLLMCCFRSAWADWVTVPTGSMNPTILEGDRVLVDKHAYGLRVPFTLIHVTWGGDPVRGEIVVFDSPKDGTSLVKRVIGVPGDTVELDGRDHGGGGEHVDWPDAEPAGRQRHEQPGPCRPGHAAQSAHAVTVRDSLRSREWQDLPPGGCRPRRKTGTSAW